jgi:hypothetical protein
MQGNPSLLGSLGFLITLLKKILHYTEFKGKVSLDLVQRFKFIFKSTLTKF